MHARTYDVTLYWHDGGSLFLGVVSAMTPERACDMALNEYVNASAENHKTIENGGGFQVEAELA